MRGVGVGIGVEESADGFGVEEAGGFHFVGWWWLWWR